MTMGTWRNMKYSAVYADDKLLKEFIAEYNKLSGKKVDACNTCNGAMYNAWMDYHKLYYGGKTQQVSKCSYKLKDGILVTMDGIDYSNATLTDSIAKAIIERNHKNVAYFEVIPQPAKEPVKELLTTPAEPKLKGPVKPKPKGPVKPKPKGPVKPKPK
jgi:hypothetical protein